MSNHLRELIEILDQNAPVFNEGMTEEQMDQIYSGATTKAQEALCFFAGKIEHLNVGKIIDSLVRLPFPVCWVEMTHETKEGSFLFGHLMWEVSGEIHAQAWRKHAGKWRFMFAWIRHGDGKSSYCYGPDDATTSMIKGMIFYAYLFLCVMNCKNISRIEQRPPIALQNARAKRGKKPLFSYWVLEIKTNRIESEYYGGSHSSPRLHLCRGHFKILKSGVFWWSPHLRGSKGLGMVHKDYRLDDTRHRPIA